MQRNKHYKNNRIRIFPIVFLLGIPVLLYFLISNADLQYISQICAETKEKYSIISVQDVVDIVAKDDTAAPSTAYVGKDEKTYILGNLGNEYDWTLPYLVSGAQYGGYSHPDKVAYCVDLTAPTIARVDKNPRKKRRN